MLENYNRAVVLIEQHLNNSDLIYTKFTPITDNTIFDIYCNGCGGNIYRSAPID